MKKEGKWEEIQSFVSAEQTLEEQCSQDLWSFGISPYFSENIPFSWENSHDLAEKIAVSIQAHYNRLGRPAHYAVLQVMAGMGMLPYHILRCLESKDPRLFAHLTFYMHDTREALAEAWKQSALYDHFKHKLVFFHETITIQTQLCPHFVIAVEAFSAWPAHHFQVDKGKLFHLLWRTLIPEKEEFWMVQDHIKKLSTKEVKQCIQEGEYKLYPFLKSIKPKQKMEFGRVRLVPETGVDPILIKHLNTMIRHLGVDNGFFSYSADNFYFCEWLNTLDKTQTAFWMWDSGFQDALLELPEALIKRYGLFCAHTTFKPLMAAILQNQGWEKMQSSSNCLTNQIDMAFIPFDFKHLPSFLALSGHMDAPVYLGFKQQCFEELPIQYRQDFELNIHIIYECLERGLDEEARQYALWLIHENGHAALPAVLLLLRLNKPYYEDRYFLDEYRSLLAVGETFYPLYIELIHILLKRNLVEDAFLWLKKALEKTSCNRSLFVPLVQQCIQSAKGNPDHERFLAYVQQMVTSDLSMRGEFR
jgi:hypothetical protein